ncbi:MAG: serine/threonine protein kinase, partial [Sandaracinaceae bacterium]|nr:serine/threonine protein kinase [Sandaracinaceae bacterium]
MFSVGEKVGDYEIVAQLKSGGMATLFLGRRGGVEGFSRHVAIKVVHEHLASDPSFVRMFVDEALLSAKIQHPNVVHVEELREVRGRHFLVMEYVHGCALSQLVGALRRRSRTLSPELATYVAVKLAEGLHAAHETRGSDGELLGVVHRDVSPQNVLLAYRGHVKLIDFGVAKARGRTQQTTGGSIKGKIGYMSPEQAFGRPVDRRTDVYALGVVLWESLTGRRAFTADNDFALLELVRDPKIPLAASYNPGVSAALDAVIAKATAREADDRYESAQQMRKALAQAMPAALALDASDLEKLLAATMADAIEADRRLLPQSVSGVIEPSPRVSPAQAEDVVHTLTVSAAGLALSGEGPAVDLGLAHAPTQLTPASVRTSPTGTAILEGPSSQATPLATEAPRETSRRTVIAAAALAGLALASCVGGALAVWALGA